MPRLPAAHLPRRLAAAAGLLSALGAAAACHEGRAKPAQPVSLSVFAAASLQDAFAIAAAAFTRANPQIQIAFNFAGTQQLRVQIEQGAQADVFAAADDKHIQALAARKLVQDGVAFAVNEPVVVVHPSRAEVIRTFEDLPHAERIVVGTPEVPIGRYTLQILTNAAALFGLNFPARVQTRVVSRELNVKQVLAKVRLGEAAAGIVYRTDVLASPAGVVVVDIPPEVNVAATYAVAVVAGSSHLAEARAFLAYLRSQAGQSLLRRSGFSLPADMGAP